MQQINPIPYAALKRVLACPCNGFCQKRLLRRLSRCGSGVNFMLAEIWIGITRNWHLAFCAHRTAFQSVTLSAFQSLYSQIHTAVSQVRNMKGHWSNCGDEVMHLSSAQSLRKRCPKLPQHYVTFEELLAHKMMLCPKRKLPTWGSLDPESFMILTLVSIWVSLWTCLDLYQAAEDVLPATDKEEVALREARRLA